MEANEKIKEQKRDKPKFKITKQHLQGAIAMLLVCVITFTASIISTNGSNLFGTLFKGYEEAMESPLTVIPDTVIAEKNITEQVLTVSGLPQDEISNIKPEHIYLGGYFANCGVKEINAQYDSLIVTIGEIEAAENIVIPENTDEIDWEDNSGGDGLIAVSPEAFRDKNFYYQGAVTVIYPELVSETAGIEQDYDGNISQEIVFTLENDSFIGTLAGYDLNLDGGFEYAQVENFVQMGNTLSFTLVGTSDGNFGTAYFSIPGEKLQKGYSVSVSLEIGRVAMPYQVGSLFVMNDYMQTLDIVMDYDGFTEDISLTQLSFGGVMQFFTVTSFERVDNKTLRLTLNGFAQEGTGTIRFDSTAVLSGRPGRVAEITIKEPELTLVKPVSADMENPAFTVQLAGVPRLNEGDVSFSLDGTLSGLVITDMEWKQNCVVIYTEGRAEVGEGIIRASGLYNTVGYFDIAGEWNANMEFLQAVSTNMSPGLIGLSGTSAKTGIIELPFASGNISSASFTPVAFGATLDLIGGKVGLGLLKAVVSKLASKAIDELLSSMGLSSPSPEEMLGVVINELDRHAMQANVNTNIILAKLDTVNYNITSMAAGFSYDSLTLLFDKFNSAVQTGRTSPESLASWREGHLKYACVKYNIAYDYIDNLLLLLDRIDPIKKDVLGRDHLLTAYEDKCKSRLPFEHNVYMAMTAFVDELDVELSRFLILAEEIYAYNYIEEGDTPLTDEQRSFNNLISTEMEYLAKRYVEVFTNVKDYILNRPYTSSYNNIKPAGKDNLIYIVTNTPTGKYLLADNVERYKNGLTPEIPGVRNSRGFTAKVGYNSGKNIYEFHRPSERINYEQFGLRYSDAYNNKNSGNITNFITAMKSFNAVKAETGHTCSSLSSLFEQYLNISVDGGSLWFSGDIDYMIANASSDPDTSNMWKWTFGVNFQEYGRLIPLNQSNFDAQTKDAWYVWDDMYQKKKSSVAGSTFIYLLSQ